MAAPASGMLFRFENENEQAGDCAHGTVRRRAGCVRVAVRRKAGCARVTVRKRAGCVRGEEAYGPPDAGQDLGRCGWSDGVEALACARENPGPRM